ncbi:MAG: VOC family protein [Chloroflexi bacterium]|nr:VOC family protein [Chloroflexota bacterium]
MQKITPHLWFDNQAEEAVNFYISIFKNSKLVNITRYGEAGAEVSGRPKGTVMTLAFQLDGQEFMALNGGPIFKFTPAVSFFVNCKHPQELDELWRRLADGGTVLMELDKYPFAEKYGWLQDKYGLSWQLVLASRTQKITPFLLFVGEQHGKAEEAMNRYVSIFPDSHIATIERYGKGEQDPEGTVKYAEFSLNGQEFIAMESAMEHQFTFNEAISFVVSCETQKEVDYYWEKLSEGGDEKAQQCGWLKDNYGLSWQIVPTILGEMLQDEDAKKTERVMKALLQMKKLDIETLKRAYEGR